MGPYFKLYFSRATSVRPSVCFSVEPRALNQFPIVPTGSKVVPFWAVIYIYIYICMYIYVHCNP